MVYFSNSAFNQRVSIKAAEFCEQAASDMGAELHDEVVQKLASMSFYIERIERAASEPGEVLNLVNQMRSDFNDLTGTIRAISQRLNPIHVNSGSFNQAIVELAGSMQMRGQTHINCSVKGEERIISRLTYTYLYRIVQELIQNALKHSSAWRIEVDLCWTNASLTIAVEDDGTHVRKIDEMVSLLKHKHNTLKMRCQAIGAALHYSNGKKGLVVKVEYYF
jgi:signal transduction histidine kinase